jgi:hypothetical protein
LKPLFSSRAQSYGKGLVRIVNLGHDGIFGEQKPEAMSDDLWEIVRMCWAVDPSQRPSMTEVDAMLARMHKDK